MPAVESVGYEGLGIDQFVADLVARRVDVLVDVRLNAVSRRPGFSKTALSHALDVAGVEYLHLRSLGNPRETRPAFAGADVASGREVYRSLLREPAAAAALAQLRAAAADSHVAVMCFERDERNCHRLVIIDELSRSPS